MDEVGLSLNSQFPDWQRDPLQLKLKNLSTPSMFGVSHSNCIYQNFNPSDVQKEVAGAAGLIEDALKKFQVNNLERVRVVCQGAFPSGLTFENLAIRLDRKFHKQFSEISAFDESTMTDMAYVINTADRTPSHWTRNITLGPMTKAEWRSKFPIDFEMHQITDSARKSCDERIPEVFTNITIDSQLGKSIRADAMRNLASSSGKSLKIIESLWRYCEE